MASHLDAFLKRMAQSYRRFQSLEKNKNNILAHPFSYSILQNLNPNQHLFLLIRMLRNHSHFPPEQCRFTYFIIFLHDMVSQRIHLLTVKTGVDLQIIPLSVSRRPVRLQETTKCTIQPSQTTNVRIVSPSQFILALTLHRAHQITLAGHV